MSRQRIVEEVRFAAPSSEGVLLHDRVREAGLDPEVFIAVIPGECGRAGRVNGNGRIYDVKEGIEQHEALCREAPKRAIATHLGHPETSQSWELVCRFLGGRTQVESDGSALFEGSFGVLNTPEGIRALNIWRAGFPVGVSLYGDGAVEKHKLDESSPYKSMNPGQAGREVALVTDFRLGGYDWVRVPSAGTYLTAPAGVREAAEQLREALEETMTFKDFAELQSKHPELAAQLRAQVLAEVSAAATGKGSDDAKAAVAEALKPLKEAAEADRQKAKDLEVKVAGALEQLTEANGKLAEVTTKLERADLRKLVEADLDTFVVGRPAGNLIRSQVLEDFDGGRFLKVEEAHAEAERKAKLVEGAKTGIGTLTNRVREGGDGGALSTGETKTGGKAVGMLQ